MNYNSLVKLKSLLVALAVILILSCNKEEPIPSYIHIDKITLTTNYSSEGSDSHKITDAWVFIDNKLVGAFELPVTFPYIGEGVHDILINAGIKVNGIAATRAIYSFYKGYSSTVTLNKGSVTNISPAVNYFSGITFAFNEDFESVGSIFCDTSNTDTSMQQQNAVVFEGSQSGAVFLDANKTLYFGQTCTAYLLPKGGAAVYLELNYKCNQQFAVGLTSFNSALTQQLSQNQILTVNPSDEWNKIYIYLTEEISASAGAKFKVFFSMAKESDVALPALYLDNIKLIH